MNFSITFILHFLSISFMTGIIWIIQILNYPFIKYVKDQDFVEFHFQHSSRITWIVGPAMLLQLVTSVVLLGQDLSNKFLISFFVLTVFVFLATAFLSVPQHQILSLGFDQKAYDLLVKTNWWRTFFWTLHTGLATLYFLKLIK